MNITDYIAKDPSGWDEAGDYGDIQLYNATLQIDTPKFKKGDKVECITFLFSQAVCHIHQTSGPEKDGFTPTTIVDDFPLKLTLG